jgi:hypothetical protein
MERRLDHLETEIETDVEVTRSFTSSPSRALSYLSREFPRRTLDGLQGRLLAVESSISNIQSNDSPLCACP